VRFTSNALVFYFKRQSVLKEMPLRSDSNTRALFYYFLNCLKSA
jgi:hypothetical protein